MSAPTNSSLDLVLDVSGLGLSGIRKSSDRSLPMLHRQKLGNSDWWF